MPTLYFPIRDTTGLPSAVADNNQNTYITANAGSTFAEVTFPAPKWVYGIAVLATITNQSGIVVEIYDGTNWSSLPPRRAEFVGSEVMSFYTPRWIYLPIMANIQGYRLKNNSGGPSLVYEVVTLVASSSMPTMPIIRPNSLEINNNFTQYLDSFAYLNRIVDGDDTTYAILTFRPGYTDYKLTLVGTINGYKSLQVISPIAGIQMIGEDIYSKMSNFASFFSWGCRVTTDSIHSSSTSLSPYHTARTPATHYTPFGDYYYSSGMGGYARRARTLLQVFSVFSPPRQTIFLAANTDIRPTTVVWDMPYWPPYSPIFLESNNYGYLVYVPNDFALPYIYTPAADNAIKIVYQIQIKCSTPPTQPFSILIYDLGFVLMPQMDVELPLTMPGNIVYWQPQPLNSVTRDGNTTTETPDITTDEVFISVYPTDVDVSTNAIRFQMKSTSGSTSQVSVRRITVAPNQIYTTDATYTIGETLTNIDITGPDRYDRTDVVSVEIRPL